MHNWYAVLGVRGDATAKEIIVAFREKARIYHPDKGGSHEQMQLLQKALESLTDPIKRAWYDRQLAEEKWHAETEDPKPAADRLRITSPSKPISETMRAQHAVYTAKYRSKPQPLAKRTPKGERLQDFLHAQGRYYDTVAHRTEELWFIEPFGLAAYKAKQGHSSLETIRIWDKKSVITSAVCAKIGRTFLDGQLYGEALEAAIVAIKKSSEAMALPVAAPLVALLQRGLDGKPVDPPLLTALDTIVRYVTQQTGSTLMNWIPVVQHLFFRNLYLLAVDACWSQRPVLESLRLGQSIEKARTYLKTQTDRLLDQNPEDSQDRVYLEALCVRAKTLYLYERDMGDFQPKGDAAHIDRETAWRLLDWTPTLGNEGIDGIAGGWLDAIAHLCSAARHETDPAVAMADEATVLEWAKMLLVASYRMKPFTRLYLMAQLWTQLIRMQYQWKEPLFDQVYKQVIRDLDFYPFYQPAMPLVEWIQQVPRQRDWFRILLQGYVTYAENQLESMDTKGPDVSPHPFAHSPTRIFEEAFEAACTQWYAADPETNAQCIRYFRDQLMDHLLDQSGWDMVDIADNIRSGDYLPDRTLSGWFSVFREGAFQPDAVALEEKKTTILEEKGSDTQKAPPTTAFPEHVLFDLLTNKPIPLLLGDDQFAGNIKHAPRFSNFFNMQHQADQMYYKRYPRSAIETTNFFDKIAEKLDQAGRYYDLPETQVSDLHFYEPFSWVAYQEKMGHKPDPIPYHWGKDPITVSQLVEIFTAFLDGTLYGARLDGVLEILTRAGQEKKISSGYESDANNNLISILKKARCDDPIDADFFKILGFFITLITASSDPNIKKCWMPVVSHPFFKNTYLLALAQHWEGSEKPLWYKWQVPRWVNYIQKLEGDLWALTDILSDPKGKMGYWKREELLLLQAYHHDLLKAKKKYGNVFSYREIAWVILDWIPLMRAAAPRLMPYIYSHALAYIQLACCCSSGEPAKKMADQAIMTTLASYILDIINDVDPDFRIDFIQGIVICLMFRQYAGTDQVLERALDQWIAELDFHPFYGYLIGPVTLTNDLLATTKVKRENWRDAYIKLYASGEIGRHSMIPMLVKMQGDGSLSKTGVWPMEKWGPTILRHIFPSPPSGFSEEKISDLPPALPIPKDIQWRLLQLWAQEVLQTNQLAIIMGLQTPPEALGIGLLGREPLSTSWRKQHADEIDFYVEPEGMLNDPETETETDLMSAQLFKLWNQAKRYYDQIAHNMRWYDFFYQPFDLVAWKEKTGFRVSPLDPKWLSGDLTQSRLSQLCAMFFDGDLYGSNLDTAMEYIQNNLDLLEGDKIRLLAKTVYALLERARQPDPFSRTLLLDLKTIIAAATPGEETVWTAVIQSPFFRNLYIEALHKTWQRATSSDSLRLGASLAEARKYAEKSVALDIASRTDGEKTSSDPQSLDPRVVAAICYGYASDMETYAPDGDLETIYRALAWRILDWVPAMRRIHPQLAGGLMVDAITHLRIAMKNSSEPAVQHADQRVIEGLATQIYHDFMNQPPSVRLVVLPAVLIHGYTMKAMGKPSPIWQLIQRQVIYDLDFYLGFEPLTDPVLMYQRIPASTQHFKNALSSYVHSYMAYIQRGEEKKPDPTPWTGHAPARIFSEALEAVLGNIYPGSPDLQPRYKDLFGRICGKSLSFEKKDIIEKLPAPIRWFLVQSVAAGYMPSERVEAWLTEYTPPSEPIVSAEIPKSVPITKTLPTVPHPSPLEKKEKLDLDDAWIGINGVAFDYLRGRVNFSFIPAKPDVPFAWMEPRDVQDIVKKQLSFASFSLNQAEPVLVYHPFQQMWFKPSAMRDTRLLNTCLKADLLLKFLTVGVEVRGEYPFDWRPTETLIDALPAHLKKIIHDFQEDNEDEKITLRPGAAQRFWITATHVPILPDAPRYGLQDEKLIAIGEVKMAVRTHRMVFSESGLLEDDKNDTDGRDIYILPLDLMHKEKLSGIQKPSVIIAEEKNILFGCEDGRPHFKVFSDILTKSEHAALLSLPREKNGKVIVNEDTDYILYNLLIEIEKRTSTDKTIYIPHLLKPATIFSLRFTQNFKEFSQFFPVLQELQALAGVCAIGQILKNELFSIQETKKVLESKKNFAMFKEDFDKKGPLWRSIYNSEFDFLQENILKEKQELEKGFFNAWMAHDTIFRSQLTLWDIISGKKKEDYNITIHMKWGMEKFKSKHPYVTDEELERAFLFKDVGGLAHTVATNLIKININDYYKRYKREINNQIKGLESFEKTLLSLGINTGVDLEDEEKSEGQCLWVPTAFNTLRPDRLVFGGVLIAPQIKVLKAGDPAATLITNPYLAGVRAGFLRLDTAELAARAGKASAAGGPGRKGSGGSDGSGDESGEEKGYTPPEKEKPKEKISKKSRLKKEQLPCQGLIRFIPEKRWDPRNPIRREWIEESRSKIKGFVDRDGNIWLKGPSRTPGEPFEWDVQLSTKGKLKWGQYSSDGKHLNVSLKGRITHPVPDRFRKK